MDERRRELRLLAVTFVVVAAAIAVWALWP
jgi:hypothetical protein